MRQRDHSWRTGAKAVFRTNPTKRKHNLSSKSTGGGYYRPRSSGIRKCFNCRKPGHVARDCPEPPNSMPPWPSQENTGAAEPSSKSDHAGGQKEREESKHRHKSKKRSHDERRSRHKSNKKSKKHHHARKARKEESSESGSESSAS